MVSSRKVINFALFAMAMIGPACADEVVVSDSWFRALPGGLPAGGYFSLRNTGATPIELTGAASSACGMLMLHQSTEGGGVSRMNDVRGVAVPAGGSITFAPGGYHLMCTNPTRAMAPGTSVRVTLIFANGKRMEANFAVRDAAGK